MTAHSTFATATALVLIALCQPLAALPSSQPDEFSERLARAESWERRVNERQPPDKVMDAVGVKPGMVIGEVGAGRGRYTMHLSRRVGDAGKIFANDIDAEALAFLRERCNRGEITNVETVLGDVEDPHFPEASLDMIFMVWVFHMVESPVPLLKSFGSSLKPGATVVMVEPPPEEIQRELDDMVAEESEHVLPTVLTPARMDELSSEAGFKLVKTMDELLEKDIIYILEKE
ncbi:MAG: class I SAM-dependent methyltransferase [bacterium]|nr:class I SAM-dependent methyltransferase [bacterium]